MDKVLHSKTNQKAKSKNQNFLTLALIFSLAAFLLSVYLLWSAARDGIGLAGCGEGSGCDDVMNSRWSLWLGLPVSVFAVGFYVLMVICTFAVRARRIDGDRWLPWMAAGAWAAGIMILWFVFLQAAVIRSFCIYCLADHALGFLAIGCLTLYTGRTKLRLGLVRIVFVVSVAAAFIAVHIIAAPSQMDVVDIEEVESEEVQGEGGTIQIGPAARSRIVQALDKRVSFDIYKIPCIGSREAEYVIMELFDYTCSHCRDLHKHLHHALERYGDQLAVVMLPVPMDMGCNPTVQVDYPKHKNACAYAKYGLAVCARGRDLFPEFHDWLMTGKTVTTLEKAGAKAEAVLGKGTIADAVADPLVQEWLNAGSALYKLTKFGGIPKLVVGSKVVTIPRTTSERLFEFLESTLGIQPVENDELKE